MKKDNLNINEYSYNIRNLIENSSSRIPLYCYYGRIVTIGERDNIIDCTLRNTKECKIPIYENSTFVTNTIHYKSFEE